jgi:hypothetical protein
MEFVRGLKPQNISRLTAGPKACSTLMQLHFPRVAAFFKRMPGMGVVQGLKRRDFTRETTQKFSIAGGGRTPTSSGQALRSALHTIRSHEAGRSAWATSLSIHSVVSRLRRSMLFSFLTQRLRAGLTSRRASGAVSGVADEGTRAVAHSTALGISPAGSDARIAAQLRQVQGRVCSTLMQLHFPRVAAFFKRMPGMGVVQGLKPQNSFLSFTALIRFAYPCLKAWARPCSSTLRGKRVEASAWVDSRRDSERKILRQGVC